MNVRAKSLTWLLLSRAMLCALFMQSAPSAAQESPAGTGQHVEFSKSRF